MNPDNLIKLDVNILQQPEIAYPILIGYNFLNESASIISNYTRSQKLLIVSNETVYPIYGKKLEENLVGHGFQVGLAILPDGENFKNIDSFKMIIDKAVDSKLERKDSIIALGGGVIGDISGFAASSYLRGVNFIQIPTTLLAQVDASVGGKVGINHIKGKNLIGAFYQPTCVLIDTSTLKTLDNRNLKNGLGEVLKYAFIEKSCNNSFTELTFFDFLNNNIKKINQLDRETITEMVKYCCVLKVSVVQNDEKESGLRAILNLGHTIGHALEACGKYSLLMHGEAISIGMIAAFKLAYNLELIDEDHCNKSMILIKNFGLPYKIPPNINVQDILESMKFDKKNVNEQIRLILPIKELGNVDIFDNISCIDILNSLKLMY